VKCERLVAEAGAVREPRRREHPLLEDPTMQRLSKSEDFICAIVTMISGVCNLVSLS
jgi:hypothetical protein